jgi:3-dehydroquinate synthase
MIRVPVKTPSRSYEAVIESGVLNRAGEILTSLLRDQELYVITVPAVRRRWGKVLLRSLKLSGFSIRMIEMPEGERFKRLSTLEVLAGKMVKLGADRHAGVLAFGGGVVGDVGGMLASIYMRGLKLVQVPTTVQAQLDAAIGGKTGVNLREGKNLIGTFFQPELVLIDPETLRTLPDREFRAGMYEALKCGVIGNKELFDRLRGCSIRDLRRDQEFLTWTIAESVRLKADVVCADEKEGDLRRVLNFGHTIGHALEAATAYRHFLHGEAVAWGMIAAARIAAETGGCNDETYEQIRGATLAWGRLPRVTVASPTILKLIQSDKKTEKGTVNFVLPKEIGRVEVVKNIPAAAIQLAMDEIRRLSRG